MFWFYDCDLMHVGLVEAILAGCKDFMWETEPRGAGLPVFNAFTNEWFTLWMVLVRVIEDTVGLTKPLCCRKQPARIGVHVPPYIKFYTRTFVYAHTRACFQKELYIYK